MAQVLIIGASRGIGLELVKQHRASGDTVVATARDEASLEKLRAQGATAIKLDVSDMISIAGLAWQLDGYQFNRVMYVAGLYGPKTIGLQPPSAADFDAVMHTNVLGPMRANSAGWVYRASKAAVNSVMKDVALTLDGRASCVSLHPGWVKTDMGGQEADIDVATSASSLRQVLDGLKPGDNGGFFNYDGSPLPW